jgi:Na+/melibiose symporter-like transporter
MPLIMAIGKGNMGRGYQFTAGIYIIAAMLLFWMVFAGTKEVITFTQKSGAPLSQSFRIMFGSRNIVCYILNQIFFMFGIMGRIGIAVYYYLHVVKRPDLIGIFMSLPTIVGIVAAPFAPLLVRKMGVKNAVIFGTILHIIGIAVVFFASASNLPILFLGHIIYGAGYLGGMNTGALLRDAVDAAEYKTGHRVDGTVSGFTGFSTKTGGAIGSSLGLFAIGLSGYVGGQEVTSVIAGGINRAVNLVPIICLAVSLVPLLLYNLSEKEGKEIHDALEARRDQEAGTV